MAAISKRTQARNEKALQDLIRTVPGNERCADCGARNPGWASWSLGIFLCMRCASLHRKLGTHISKVKSLSMDSWSNEQVENMKHNGNIKVNKAFNPNNTKPSIPLDVDEVDPVFERFIRQKYDQQLFINGAARPAQSHNTGSTRSSDEDFAALPPKPTRRFGFGLRSTSAAFPARNTNPLSPMQSPEARDGWDREPAKANKQSRVFGAALGGGNGNFEAKLAQLRDMGFADESRNASILKSLGGNVERTIEALVRLGEGSGPASRTRTPVQPAKKASIAASTNSESPNKGMSNGIGISFGDAAPAMQKSNVSPTPVLDQPFSAPPPQATATTKAFSATNPYQQQAQSYNPFDPSNDHRLRIASMDQAFSNMQVTQQPQQTHSQQQPLFPHATGGYPAPLSHMQDGRFQSMTPPVQANPQIFSTNPFLQQGGAAAFPNQTPLPSNPASPNAQSPSQASVNSYNPFLPQSTVTSPQLPQSAASPQAYSPYSQQGMFSPVQQPLQQTLPTIPQGYPPPQHVGTDPLPLNGMSPQALQQQNLVTDPSLFNGMPQQAPQQQQQQQTYLPTSAMTNGIPQQTQSPQPQLNSHFDKSSILALYNYPQLAPQPSSPPSNNQPVDSASAAPPTIVPQRSVTMPLQSTTGSKNPFQPLNKPMAQNAVHQVNGPFQASNGMSAPGPVPQVSRHVSQESVDIGGFQNGRHSPDAFASLSARHIL